MFLKGLAFKVMVHSVNYMKGEMGSTDEWNSKKLVSILQTKYFFSLKIKIKFMVHC